MYKIIALIAFCFAAADSSAAQAKVLAFSGSTRTDSLNKKLIREAAAAAEEMGAAVTLIDLKEYQLPLYDGDLEDAAGMPANAKQLRRLMQEHDIILIASPNYNGAYSGVFKNAMDWASRTEDKKYDKSILKGKKVGLLSASPGKSGGSGALLSVRQLMTTLKADVAVRQVSVPEAHKAFDEQGHLKDPKWSVELRSLIAETMNLSDRPME